MARRANRAQAFSVLSGLLACTLAVSLSVAGCGGLADDRRGAPVAMFGGHGGTSGPSDGDCNPFVGVGCEAPDPAVPVCNPFITGTCEPPTVGSGGGSAGVESCEENPFLPECGVPPPEPEPNQDRETPLIVAAAENVLATNCGQCHGDGVLPEFPGNMQGGLGDIQDLSALTRAGFVVDCSAERSRVIQVMRSGSMPPLISGLPPVPPVDIDIVASAIELRCTESEKLCAGDPALPGCDVVRAERALERNCGACHGAQAREAARFGEGMPYVDDMVALIENAQVLPCRPESSPLLIRARNGSMPPPDSRLGSPLNSVDDATLTSFIDGLCPGPASPEAAEQLQVEGLLGTYCGDCHGQRAVELEQVQGGMSDIESVDALIRAGRLVPCVSRSSPVIQAMRDGSMPPPASLASRPSDVEIQLIADFVNRPCVEPRE